MCNKASNCGFLSNEYSNITYFKGEKVDSPFSSLCPIRRQRYCIIPLVNPPMNKITPACVHFVNKAHTTQTKQKKC